MSKLFAPCAPAQLLPPWLLETNQVPIGDAYQFQFHSFWPFQLLTFWRKNSSIQCWWISCSITFLLAISITYLLEKNSGTHRWWMSISITFLLVISITYLLEKKFKYPSMMDVNFNYISFKEKNHPLSHLDVFGFYT